ncbi:50S ribosomal protein L11 methyltransferase [Amphritea japonica]|uniref:Ribosomal protein L11 methyltransferase n=1 Tax=Amphritea japonica ATCC BAA-1530 TaxID=1278309 RepID=A0A7R6STE3_9GAMM|nr:50S ribosomal protein L11 methyltransferase [Amphritea japonica]BBB27329.1 ribosomal protein L11 methyltransferase [Amphritea japonica ATCC BAA-1530]
MPWLQIKLDVLPDNADQYEDLLLAAGCAAVTLQDKEDQPIFEPDLGTTPLWRNTVLTGLFSADHDLEATELFLKESHLQLFPNTPFPSMKTEILEDKDWEREWMDNYHPMKFGKRLWVCPSWKAVPEPDAVNLMLDPGLAFGTGTHPTTALCLEFLDQLALEGKQVVDYGCGSGILGIAALLLGAQHVTAVDIDPQALDASLDNLQRNQLPKESLKVFFPEKAPQDPADLVVANILAGPLVQLAPTLSALCKTGGQLILSGLLSDQETEIREAYGNEFELDIIAEKEGWIRVTGLKR